MSALAIAAKNNGWKVTGSDAGFYPPVSDHLTQAGISFYPGWHPEKILATEPPDLVVVGNVAASSNPEWEYVQQKQLPFVSYPEFISRYLLKPESIVTAGTYGKTTTAAMLSWLLSQIGLKPSYMFGGLANNFPSAQITASHWSVLEGDEYKTARWDQRPKFLSYAPKYLLLTAVEWDHADIYPTAKDYVQTFTDLVASLPPSGCLVYCADNAGAVSTAAKTAIKKISYGQNPRADYVYHLSRQNLNGLKISVQQGEKTWTILSPLLGAYMAENIVGAFVLAKELGWPEEKIIAGLASFPGIKRRLEKRYEKKITVIDDIAHSPLKVPAVLATLRQTYLGKIWVVFEPNTGSRQNEAVPLYDQAFALADIVIIPRLTKIKQDKDNPKSAWEGDELAKIIGHTHKNVNYEPDDDRLIRRLKQETKEGDVIAFLGSHGFRGMIERLIQSLP